MRLLGPGLVLAATGVGAGDLVAAAVSGTDYGYAVAWAALAGAAIKFALNEGIARWQLATGETLLEGWARRLSPALRWAFLAYLVLWSFVVAGALMSACGLAAHAVAPGLSVATWGMLHSAAAAALVLFGRYRSFERTIGVFVAVMFVALIGAALLVAPPVETVARAVSAAGVPRGAGPAILGVIGGVGGSVTLLSYGYWIREKGWSGPGRLRTVRIDLAVAYGLTGLFGFAVVVLAAEALHGRTQIAGSGGALTMAEMLGSVAGPAGRWAFLVGFWGAVATSMLGVWQGIPYLFADFVRLQRGGGPPSTRGTPYRAFLAWLALPPAVLLAVERPVAMVVVYAVASALFMPFLAATLLYMNARRRWVGALTTGPVLTGLLVLGLVLFCWLAGAKLLELLA